MSEKIVYPCLGHETYDDYVDCDCNFASSHECWQYQQKKIDQLKEKLEKAIKTLQVVCAQYKCDCDDGVFESQELSRQTLKEIRGEK